MRITYLHQYFSTPESGGGTRSFEMARRFVAWGHEVDLITSVRKPESGGSGRGWRITDEDGIRVHWLPVPYDNAMGFRGRVAAFLRFALGASRRAASLRSDVVFATSTPLTIALPALWASRLRRTPMVFEVRDLWPEVPIALGVLSNPAQIAAARALEWAAYRGARQVVALSETMAEGVAARGVDRSRIHVVPNASDLELFRPEAAWARAFRSEHTWLGDRPLVVYTGTLGLVNGVGYLARLAAAVRPLFPEVRFLIVGSGRERDEVRDEARSLGVLDETLFMLPPMSKPEVARVLAAADVATSVVIDVEETWGNSANKLFDGLASGTAVAINHRGWQAELLEQTGAGLVLDPHDLDAAASKLVTALRDPAWAAAAGAEARRVAEERFDREVLTRRVEAVLLSAASER